MNSFKRLLKDLQEDTEKSVWQRRDRFTDKELTAYLEGKRIHHQKFVLLLGEWAWEEFSNSAPDASRFLSTYEYVEIAHEKIKKQTYPGFWMLLDITIGCLGKKEVEKRLAKLSHRGQSDSDGK